MKCKNRYNCLKSGILTFKKADYINNGNNVSILKTSEYDVVKL